MADFAIVAMAATAELEHWNEIFFVCIGPGHDHRRVAVFCSSGKNEILGAKSGCNSRQLITPAGIGAHGYRVVYGFCRPNLVLCPKNNSKNPGGQVIYCAGPMNDAVAVCSDIWDLATFFISARIHRQHPK